MTTSIYGISVDKTINKQIVNIKPKVYGLGFPVGSRSTGGYLFKQAGIDLIKNNLKQLLRTEKGERVMMPNYGVSLRKFVFQPMDQQTFEELTQEVQSAISKYATGVKIIKLAVVRDDRVGFEDVGSLIVKLSLELRELENQVINLELTI